MAVSGQCLGGGLELVSAGHLIFASPDARLGQPEIQIGVFAPAASCLLPERIGLAAAEDMLISGRSITAEEAFTRASSPQLQAIRRLQHSTISTSTSRPRAQARSGSPSARHAMHW